MDAGSDSATDAGDASTCVPNCVAQKCGDDGCGHPCPPCPTGTTCGGGGITGLCGAAEPSGYPGQTPTQISTTTPAFYWVAPDEKHVAFLSYDTTCSTTATAGPLSVATLQSDGTWSTQLVDPEVSPDFGVTTNPAVAWSPDGTQLVYASAGSCSASGGAVWIAAADGTGKRQLYAYAQGFVMGGQSLLIQGVDYSNQTYPWNLQYVALPSGSAQLVAYLETNNAQLLTINPAGTAYLFDTYYVTYSGTFLVQTSAPTTLTNKVDDGLDFWSFDSWSPDGTQFAFAQAPSNSSYIGIDAMPSAGGNARGWCSYGSGGYFRGWLPNSRYSCATEVDLSTDVGTLLVDDGSGGTYTLSVPFAGSGIYYANAAFDAAGDVVYAVAGTHLLSATTTASGTFNDLSVAMPATPAFSVAPSGAYCAARMGAAGSSSEIDVFAQTTTGGLTRISTAMTVAPLYEDVRGQRLLVLDTSSGTSGALQIWSQDGGTRVATLPGQTPQSVPAGWPAPYEWLGSEAVFAVTSSTGGTDLAASTDDGTTSGVLAANVATWETAQKPVPTRVFYTVTSGAGGGLWSTGVPQSP